MSIVAAGIAQTEAVSAGVTLDVAGVPTHYHDAGDGPPLLLLHGSGPGVSAWSNWRAVYPALSTVYRVIAPDQLGFSATAPPAEGRYGRSAWTEHAFALMDALGIERYDVVGNSMGGAIALSMAVARRTAIGRIVVMGTMGIGMRLPPGLDTAWRYEPSREAMRELIELFAFDHAIVTDDLIELRLRASVAPGIQESFSSMFPQPRQRWIDDLALTQAELESIDQPVLLVHGYNDAIIPFEQTSLKLMGVLRDARLHVFGRCGHWVMIEHTNAFSQLVLNFLDEDRKAA